MSQKKRKPASRPPVLTPPPKLGPQQKAVNAYLRRIGVTKRHKRRTG